MATLALHGLRPIMLAFICTFLGACLTFLVLAPTVGFDDANITLNYAENIAAGHGYVYNIGGERVEGSTSPLWTAINTAAYLLPGVAPETSLAVLGFLVAWMTVWMSMVFGETIFALIKAPKGVAALLVGVGFLALPAYFGWVIWSLMDFGFWVMLIMATIWISSHFVLEAGGRKTVIALSLIGAMMTITRPEGIAVVFGFAGLLAAIGATKSPRRFGPALAMLLAGGLSYAILGAVRFAYFGDIFPNTYYAKVSTDYMTQLSQGVRYLKQFVSSPLPALILISSLAVPLMLMRNKWAQLRKLWLFTIVATFSGIALYTLIGGDHFGSFRFFLFVYPALLPFAALALVKVWAAVPQGAPRWTPAALAGALLLATSANFAVQKGGYDHELRIAENGRLMGEILNRLPGSPSIGIVAAGGVAMTYDGQVYDLMGLNWVDMARADRHLPGTYVNHGGFSPKVFYDTKPEIFHPQFGECDKEAYDSNRFFGRVLRWIVREEQFQELYDFECFEGLRYYRLAASPNV